MSQGKQDPGWGPVVKPFLTFWLRPWRPPSTPDALTTLRSVFLSLLASSLLIGFVLLFIVEDGFGEPYAPIGILVILLGLCGVVAARWTQARWAPTDSLQALAGLYRTNFFLGFAATDIPLLIAFTFTYLGRGQLWPYVFDLPFFLVGMAVIAPTRSNLERIQQ